MKQLICALLILTSIPACSNYSVYYDKPVMNIPPGLRQPNWGRYGSCVHASLIMLLRWQNQNALASSWPYSEGEYYTRFCERLDRAGIKYASTFEKKDVSFLEWAVRTRRGCMVDCQNGRHMIILVDLDRTHATLLDNNNVKKFKKVPRDKFLKEWFNAQSWALTVVYAPPPPPIKR